MAPATIAKVAGPQRGMYSRMACPTRVCVPVCARPGTHTRVGQAIREYIPRWGPATLAIVAGAILLRLVAGVGFVNYDTLYGLVWGQQLTRGETPEYGLPIAPTPHPLVEI